nr:hypothetical protein [Novipirellula aureliae]
MEYLLGDEARWITGQHVRVDDGDHYNCRFLDCFDILVSLLRVKDCQLAE